MSIGQKLKKLRQKRNILQKDVYSKLKIPNNTYSNYENDRRDPDYETLQKIANYFNVSTDYLLGYENNDEYERLIASINIKYLFKFQIFSGQFLSLDNVIDKLYSKLSTYYDDDEMLIKGYSHGSLYNKLYKWINAIELPDSMECSYLCDSLDRIHNISDDEIRYDILNQDMSTLSILADEKSNEYGDKYNIALEYEKDIKIALILPEFAESQSVLKSKLKSLEVFLDENDNNQTLYKTYLKVLEELRNKSDLYLTWIDTRNNKSSFTPEIQEINEAIRKMTVDQRIQLLNICKAAFPDAFNKNAQHPTGYSSDLKAFNEVTGARTYLAQQQWSAEDGRTTDQLTDDEATARATTIYNNNLKNTK